MTDITTSLISTLAHKQQTTKSAKIHSCNTIKSSIAKAPMENVVC